MKYNSKIFISILVIMILIFLQIGLNFKIQKDSKYVKVQMQEVELPLEYFSEKVATSEALLTGDVHASVLHFLRGEKNSIEKHRIEYLQIAEELDKILEREAKILIDQSQRTLNEREESLTYLKEISKFNTILRDLQEEAFEEMNNEEFNFQDSGVIGIEYKNYRDLFHENSQKWLELENEITLRIEKEVDDKFRRNTIYLIIISTLILSSIVWTMFLLEGYLRKMNGKRIKK